MKYVATLFWSLLLGQVTYYLGSALTGETYHLWNAIYLGVGMAFFVFVIQYLIVPNPYAKDKKS